MRAEPVWRDGAAGRASSPRRDEFGFAADIDVPIPYMQRTRDYYQALGYGPAYRGRIMPTCPTDAVEAAILVPNCPVCHQSVSLAGRLLEADGIATVIMGCAKDIVEHVGVPRFLFSDFPLGNAAGKPDDEASQALTLELALRLLDRAPAARTTLQSPLIWSEDPDWKLDYANAARLTAEEIARHRADYDRERLIARAMRADLRVGSSG